MTTSLTAAAVDLLLLPVSTLTWVHTCGLLLFAVAMCAHQWRCWWHGSLDAQRVPRSGHNTPVPVVPRAGPLGNLYPYFWDPCEQARLVRERYGRIYVSWLHEHPLLIVGDASVAKNLYCTIAGKRTAVIKSPTVHFGYPFGLLVGHSLGVMNGALWRSTRRVFASHFSGRSVRSIADRLLSSTLQHHLASPFPAAHTAAALAGDPTAHGGAIHCFHFTRTLVTELIGQVCYGEAFDGAALGELVALKELQSRVFTAGFTAGANKVFTWLQRLPTALNHDVERYRELWRAYNFEGVGTRADPDSLYACALRAHLQGTLTEKQMLETVDELMIANTDVSGAVLSWLLVHAAHNPAAQQRLCAELVTATDPTAYMHSCDTYLHRFVLESARLRPAIPITLPEELEEPLDDPQSGLRVPAHLAFSLDIYAINRDPTVWRHPHRFDPDRHLTVPPDSFHRFGLGQRRCLGQNLANWMLKSLLIGLLARYRLEPRGECISAGPDNLLRMPPFVVSDEVVLLRPRFPQ
jgi:gliotoxin/aspirochlorine/mycotoxins biosynthesis cytochrome P450 monooxygenase